MSEKSFQSYFMKLAKHAYRTSLTTGSGFPDVIVVHENDTVSFVELKMLLVGPSGDKRLKSLFKPSQPPWYRNFIFKGGRKVFVAFKLNNGYGLLRVTVEFIANIDTIKYSQMKKMGTYSEYTTLKELLENMETRDDIS